MATAHLEFDLTNEDDIRDHLCAIHGIDLAMFVSSLKHHILHKCIKDALAPHEIVQLINEHIENLGFDIDELVI